MQASAGSLLAIFASTSLVILGAGSVWQDKDFSQWTDKDAQSIMTDSPWAKQVVMPASGRPAQMVIEPLANGAPPPSASLGNPANASTGVSNNVTGIPGPESGAPDPTGTRSTSDGKTPSGVSGPVGAPEPEPVLTIIWASAMPVRLAVLRLRLAGNTPTQAQVENATRTRPNYVIAVTGLPAPDGSFDPKALAAQASLSVHGKPALTANESNYRQIGNSNVYFFHFTRTALPITQRDHEVEFKMRIGQMEIKKKFDLKEMLYQGRLAL